MTEQPASYVPGQLHPDLFDGFTPIMVLHRGKLSRELTPRAQDAVSPSASLAAE